MEGEPGEESEAPRPFPSPLFSQIYPFNSSDTLFQSLIVAGGGNKDPLLCVLGSFLCLRDPWSKSGSNIAASHK